jgi:hypothetical protein
MVDASHRPLRPSLAERHLGLIAVVAGALGMVAICGSPMAFLAYAAELASTVWAVATAIVG